MGSNTGWEGEQFLQVVDILRHAYLQNIQNKTSIFLNIPTRLIWKILTEYLNIYQYVMYNQTGYLDRL